MTAPAKYTPGPWHVGMRQAERIVYDAKGWAVANATVYHGKMDAAETLSNARLIASAPDLAARVAELEAACAKADFALTGLLDRMSADGIGWYAERDARDACRAALARTSSGGKE